MPSAFGVFRPWMLKTLNRSSDSANWRLPNANVFSPRRSNEATPGSRLSARAAFSAHTRGGWRAARIDETGELAPGTPATFAVWDLAGELVVQTPDERVSAWSTDPRAGVAGLPDLSGPDPVCRRTVVRGLTIWSTVPGEVQEPVGGISPDPA